METLSRKQSKDKKMNWDIQTISLWTRSTQWKEKFGSTFMFSSNQDIDHKISQKKLQQ